MTAADLRTLLRAHPEAALVLLEEGVKIAGPWREQDLIPQWIRWHSPGMITRDASSGRWMAWGHRRLGLYDTLAEAQAAVDVDLRAQDWILVDR